MKKKARLFAVLMALVLVFALAACSATVLQKNNAAKRQIHLLQMHLLQMPQQHRVKKPSENYVIGISPLTTQHEYYIGYLERHQSRSRRSRCYSGYIRPQLGRCYTDFTDRRLCRTEGGCNHLLSHQS